MGSLFFCRSNMSSSCINYMFKLIPNQIKIRFYLLDWCRGE